MNQPHDKAYKRLFAHREPVEDLLRGYVARDWIELLDLTTLERAPTEFISEASHRRNNDIIWRVRWRHEKQSAWLYIYVFLEFQSNPAPDMVLRLAEYITLFYRDLIKAKQVPTGAQLELPPVIPVVLYNGKQRWIGPTRLSQIICTPAQLTDFQLSMRFLLLDETRIETSNTDEKNLVSMLFRLEQSRSPDDLIAVTAAMAHLLSTKEQGTIRQALASFIQESLTTRLQGFRVPPTLTLEEVPQMIGENIADWSKAQIAKAEAAAKAKGRAEGEAQGRAEGRAEGKKEGETHALIIMLNHLVDKGTLSIDEARAQLKDLMASGQIPVDAGQLALDQLG